MSIKRCVISLVGTAESLLGRPLDVLFGQSEQRAEFEGLRDELRRGKSIGGRCTFARCDGTTFLGDMQAGPVLGSSEASKQPATVNNDPQRRDGARRRRAA